MMCGCLRSGVPIYSHDLRALRLKRLAKLDHFFSDRPPVPEKRLKLRNPAQDEQRLLLFWEVAQPLERLLAELPDTSQGVRMTMSGTTPLAAVRDSSSQAELLNKASASQLELAFPNLPENQFEQLALRFRPFFMNDEETYLPKILNLLGDLNPELRDWVEWYKERWEKAVFWGAMGMPSTTPPVRADDIIRAGFYSRYFHVKRNMREKAKEYEATLGKDMFRVALVSSVWRRSELVVSAANHLEDVLMQDGILDDKLMREARTAPEQPDEIKLVLSGGPGSLLFGAQSQVLSEQVVESE